MVIDAVVSGVKMVYVEKRWRTDIDEASG